MVFYVPLSERLNPSTELITFQYCKTTDRFKVSSISLVSELLFNIKKHMDNSFQDWYDFSGVIIKNTYSVLGLEYNHNAGYDVKDIIGCLRKVDNTEFIDILEISFYFAHIYCYYNNISKDYVYLEEELNQILKREGIGYVSKDGQFIKQPEEIVMEQIVTPCLYLLKSEHFDAAESYICIAYKKFKEGDNNAAIVNASNAVESAIKQILDGLSISYDRSTASILVKKLTECEFFPNYLNDVLTSLEKLLISQSNVRNIKGGHGNTTIVAVDDFYVQYALNSAMTNILLLVGIYRKNRIR